MASLDGRVSKLEAAAGAQEEECCCPGVGPRIEFEFDWRPEEERPPLEPECCPRCGRRRPVLRVVYLEDWRTDVH